MPNLTFEALMDILGLYEKLCNFTAHPGGVAVRHLGSDGHERRGC
jgi:hypothetical protein